MPVIDHVAALEVPASEFVLASTGSRRRARLGSCFRRKPQRFLLEGHRRDGLILNHSRLASLYRLFYYRPIQKRERDCAQDTRTMKQLTLDERYSPGRGGRRENAGRKPGRRPCVLHRVREVLKYWNPVHITMRADRRLPDLRSEMLYQVVERAIRATRREDFRIVEYSVQTDHLHLLVEADDEEALSRGMKSFAGRVALRINVALHRKSRAGRPKGRVWGDRYHRRDLKSARQVRNAIVYVLANYKKHFGEMSGMPRIDPFSSAPWFEGWIAHRKRPETERPCESANTVLLRTAWQKHGFIHPGEAPRTLN